MSDNNKEPDQTEETLEDQGLKISDDLIAVFRELVQLSLLTGTNIVDHMRAVRVEVADNNIIPTEQYVKDYNAYIEELERQAETLQDEMQNVLAGDEPTGPVN